jgi:hypothetical protein
MNWDELRSVDESGVLDVQSHSLTHTWHFTDPEIVTCYFRGNAARYPWIAWNARPDRKPFYLSEDQSAFVEAGTPVFKHEKSLIARRFLPDETASLKLMSAYPDFCSNFPAASEGWIQDYRRFVSRVIGAGTFPGRHETEEEHEARVQAELSESKRIIEEKLDKSVNYLCWPGGGTDALCKRLAGEVGYRSWTLPSREQVSKRNRPRTNPAEIKRLPAMRDSYFFGRNWGAGSERLTLLDIYSHQESFIHNILRKIYKVAVAAGVAGQR